MTDNRSSVGLVLSGGGARGLAHIGVLRVLEREGIPVDYLAGTSMGGIIAAGYAAGMSSIELEQIAFTETRKRQMLRLADPGLPKGGFIRGRRMYEFFKRNFGEKTFSELQLPLAVVAVDLNTSREVVLDEGPLALALRATTSVPGVFMPVEMNGQRLVDGGVLNNLPVDVVRKMGAKVVIAVDIGLARMGGVGYWIGNRRWVPGGIATTLEVIDDTIFALRVAEQANKLQQFPPGVLISPELPKSVNTFTGYDRVAELVATGERAAEEHLDEIRALIYPPRHWWFFRKQVEVDHHLAQ